jgi:hypothetical protein
MSIPPLFIGAFRRRADQMIVLHSAFDSSCGQCNFEADRQPVIAARSSGVLMAKSRYEPDHRFP